MLTLGISAFREDAAAALVNDGKVLAAASQEVYSHQPHCGDMPTDAVNSVLNQLGITLADLDAIAFYRIPSRNILRRAASSLKAFPRTVKFFKGSGNVFPVLSDGDRNSLADPIKIIENTLNIRLEKRSRGWSDIALRSREHLVYGLNTVRKTPVPVAFVDYTNSAAAGIFFLSGFDESAIISFASGGLLSSSSLGYGKDKSIRIYEKSSFPDVPCFVTAAISEFFGLEDSIGNMDYIFRLSLNGDPERYRDAFKDILPHDKDGLFRINQQYFNAYPGSRHLFKRKLPLVLGRPCRSEEELTQRHMDVAASFIERFNEAVMEYAHRLYRISNSSRLCVAGPEVLNAALMTKLRNCGPFEEIFALPFRGDEGAAAGAALFLNLSIVGREKFGGIEHLHLGESFDEDECRYSLGSVGIRPSRPVDIAETAAEMLSTGESIAWFQGRQEFGSKSLGARSLIMDPRKYSTSTQYQFCCNDDKTYGIPEISILESDAKEWLKCYEENRHNSSSEIQDKLIETERQAFSQGKIFLSLLNEAKKEQLQYSEIKDFPFRVQIVSQEKLPRFYKLIESFKKITGIPMVVSFSLKRDTAVCNPAEGIAAYLASPVRALALGPFWIDKGSAK